MAIAVRNLDEVAMSLKKIFNVELSKPEEVSSEKVRIAFVHVGGVRLEFLEPISKDSPISSFLEKKGQGMHHIAFEVENLEKCLKVLKAKAVPLIHEEPQKGAEGAKIAFMHPKAIPGLLLEFIEY